MTISPHRYGDEMIRDSGRIPTVRFEPQLARLDRSGNVTLLAHAVLACLSAYQNWFAPRIAARCRYHLSCSQYMRAAILKRGLIRGVWLGASRVVSCGPWSKRPYHDAP